MTAPAMRSPQKYPDDATRVDQTPSPRKERDGVVTAVFVNVVQLFGEPYVGSEFLRFTRFFF
ncbi:hypothetical protein CH92_10285 [Stutzerimonas stutzeri]|uniref:Uncharacterized protein n=1 Tax=Stutzerimonas stutzeri TaxID=316 RepID=W8RD20_STUST|nr:hypothetical protein CH92_10285 [Stutzerimonas stutzeri]